MPLAMCALIASARVWRASCASYGGWRKVAPVEDVRMCRSCGHIDAADSSGRCRHCGLFSELAILPRTEAERLARQRQRRALRRRLLRLAVALALVGGATVWASGVFLDLGPNPPSATTRDSASLAPHTWAQVRRTPHSSGFTPDAAPFPHQVTW